MAIKIISDPKDVAVKFRCSCDCEFWADKYDMKTISINSVTVYEAKCPNCDKEVRSGENPVPFSEVFSALDRLSNWVKEREQKKKEIETIKRERAWLEARRYYGD